MTELTLTLKHREFDKIAIDKPHGRYRPVKATNMSLVYGPSLLLLLAACSGGGGTPLPAEPAAVDPNEILFIDNEFDNAIIGGKGADVIDGAGGNDWLDYSGAESRVSVSLFNGNGTSGDALGDIITNIENLIGTDYDDFLTGDSGDNILIGGIGADFLGGGGGNDTVDYSASDAGIEINFITSRVTGGHATGDRLVRIESAIGTDFDDVFVASVDANHMSGGLGSDTLDYSASDAAVSVNLQTNTGSGGHAEGDQISGFEIVIGSAFDDSLTGDAGDNVLIGGVGTDVLDGAGGEDTLDYSASDAGVNINLATNEASGGHAQGDQISGFENVIGSAHGDTLTGDGNNNLLFGGAGADTITGGAGADTIKGGAGDDTLTGNEGNDVFVFLDQSETSLLEFSNSAQSLQNYGEDVITDFSQGDRLRIELDRDNSIHITSTVEEFFDAVGLRLEVDTDLETSQIYFDVDGQSQLLLQMDTYSLSYDDFILI